MIHIGMLAKRAGVSTSAIRYYESEGLLRSRRLPNGYRVYDENAILELHFVRRTQGLGITLKEIRRLLEMWRSGRQPCDRVRDLARRHLEEIEDKIRDLQTLRKQLRTLLRRQTPSGRGGAICPMIECADAPTYYNDQPAGVS